MHYVSTVAIYILYIYMQLSYGYVYDVNCCYLNVFLRCQCNIFYVAINTTSMKCKIITVTFVPAYIFLAINI